ncbi:hypothetical protein PV326_006993 [Microctonus aethiopoides]|nr:hypothetical protein PV326_006993 [Microctonus aethiopoides]
MSEQNDNQENSNNNNVNNNATCVVCYKNVEIYSIGMCEHPVCYECSTRMRVLCGQNECPICRQDLPKIVFTKNIKPFRHLKKGNLYDTRYSVYFDSPSIQEKFTQLLAHVCTLCEEKQIFSTFHALKDHMRRKHELHYCDLCVENLKIFSFERRCYSRADLVQHRRKGDIDDKSHKGHPLCEFCDFRYMDNDELFRHLRRDHLYCHFCDADGLHQYYSSYDYLRDHFRQEHYLCEEGDCAEEKFTSVFRTDIDLKAHKASIHGKHLGKAAAKQARTLELEFTLAPRGDNRNGGGRRGGQLHGAAGPSSSRNNISNDYGIGNNSRDYSESQSHGNRYTFDTESHFVRQPDVQSTEEFPSLGNSAPTIPNLNQSKSQGRGNLTICGSIKSKTLAITDENFPALGPESSTNSGSSKTVNLSVYSSNKSGPSGLQRAQNVASNVSIHVNHKTNGSITTRVSGPNIRIRPSQLSMDSEFPALGRGDSSTSTANAMNSAAQWTKVTCVKSNNSLKASNSKAKKIAPAPILNSTPPASPTSFTDAFPSLPKSTRLKKQLSISVSSNAPSSSSLERQVPAENNTELNLAGDSSKVNSKKKKKKKVKSISSGNNSSGNESTACKLNVNASTNLVQSDRQPSNQLNITSANSKKNARTVNENNSNVNLNNEKLENSLISKQNINDSTSTAKDNATGTNISANDTPRKRSELKIDSLNRTTNGLHNIEDFPALDKTVLRIIKSNPPPGFGAAATVTPPPPPGFAVKFNNMTLDCPNNGLTFTNSSGESYSILPDEHINLYSYVPPPDFQKRNKNLVAKISEVLGLLESIEEFRYISGLFRQGSCSAEDYYKRCRSAMGIDAFANVFPEMLVLLPDIRKQRELYYLHKKEIGENIKSLELCVTCGQVVQAGSDSKFHYSTHTLDNHFPALGEAIGMQSSNTWVRKGT